MSGPIWNQLMRYLLISIIIFCHVIPVRAESRLAIFEESIRNLPVEWAGCFDPATGIEQWRGTNNHYNRVYLDRFLCFGTTMTHNHPIQPYPSKEDIAVAQLLKLYQLRVVSKGMTCVIEKAWKSTAYKCERK